MLVKDRNPFSPLRIFREVKWEVFKTLLVNELLNATIVFFVVNFILAFFNMNSLWALAPAMLGMILRIRKSFRKNIIRQLERGNPEVNELLRTAYEYRTKNSLMIQGLMYDLTKRLRSVSTGVLLKPERILVKFIIILFLAVTPMITIGLFPTLLQENPLEKITLPNFNQLTQGVLSSDSTTLKQADEFGENNLIVLGDDEYTILVKQGPGSRNYDEQVAEENVDFSNSDGPVEIYVPSNTKTATGVGVFSDEDKELVNKYSCKLRGNCD